MRRLRPRDDAVMTVDEIAKELHVSRQMAARIIDRAMTKLRAALNSRGIMATDDCVPTEERNEK